MITPGLKRDIHLYVTVTGDELIAVHRRIADADISNIRTYMLKRAFNSHNLHVGLAMVKELTSLQRRNSTSLNQMAVYAKTYGIYS